VYNELNHKHFVEGMKLNNPSLLCKAAATAGADPVACDAFLASDGGSSEIEETQFILERLGIHSIPTFLIGGKIILSGAVHSHELIRVFREIEKAGNGAPDSAFADVLNIPNHVRQITLPPPGKGF
jgi:predicted DsbA family dithiol-disulfide isomerase